jgi:hypothetical protein
MNDAIAARACATTWAEVTRYPSGVITTPEPAPPSRVLALLCTRKLATEGSTRSATVLTIWE